MRTPLFLLLLSGCIRDTGPGPDLGACAEPPDGIYTYGEVGIGNCLAGPADLEFLELDGSTYLAVTNADPFRNFDSGSVLLVDWASIDLQSGRNLMHTLDSSALATDQFVGGMGLVADRDLLLVSGRYSEGAVTRSENDDLWVLDVSDPQAPAFWDEGSRIQVRDDPFPIVVDDERDRAWVVNLTDHSVSILDTSTTPISKIDVAGFPEIGDDQFTDQDDSGSNAEVAALSVVNTRALSDDLWTLTYIDATWRMWVPRDTGLQRYTSGDTSIWLESAIKVEIDPEQVSVIDQLSDPAMALIDGALFVFFTDGDRIAGALSGGPGVSAWSYFENPFVVGSGWDSMAGSPSLATVSSVVGLYYDGRTAEGEPASIGLAVSEDLEVFDRQTEPVLDVADTPWISLEDPFVITDPYTESMRMWLSVWDGESWQIGLSESYDGFTWTAPQLVMDDSQGEVGAPVVSVSNGRYQMFLSRFGLGGWKHAVSWSWDGVHWSDPVDVLDAEVPDDPSPPRVALQVDPSGTWRMEGANSGVLNSFISTGGQLISFDHGFSIGVSGGQALSRDLLGDSSANGLLPGSYVEVDGAPTLYVTGIGNDDRPHIGILRQNSQGEWFAVNSDVIPSGTGGNTAGANHPVVTEFGGEYVMYYSAIKADGSARIHRATSPDGLSFDVGGGQVIGSATGFDSLIQEPHGIEPLDDGGFRLWYAGNDGSRFQIGSATTSDGETFTRDPSELDGVQFSTGIPGAFDDSGVKDPFILVDGDTTHLWYAGFDGTDWSLGYASRTDGDEWDRLDNPFSNAAVPALTGTSRMFDTSGCESPVLVPDEDTGVRGWYAGFDNFSHRIGELAGDGMGIGPLFPHHRFPTSQDTLSFETSRGDYHATEIELAQSVDAFATDGIGASGLVYDEERGFLYVPSKLSASLYVIDVRDDSAGDFVDRNVNDVEAIVRIRALAATGLRDVVVHEATDRLYISGRFPDGVIAIDRGAILDDDIKQVHEGAVLGALPLRSVTVDEGVTTLAGISGAGMDLSPDGNTLVVTHFRSNAVAIFDLSRGLIGEEIGWLPYLGENPYDVEISPDGRYAAVANYVGEVDEDFFSQSTIAIIDLQTQEAITWLANK